MRKSVQTAVATVSFVCGIIFIVSVSIVHADHISVPREKSVLGSGYLTKANGDEEPAVNSRRLIAQKVETSTSSLSVRPEAFILQGTITNPDGSPVVGVEFFFVEVTHINIQETSNRYSKVSIKYREVGFERPASDITDERGYFRVKVKHSDTRVSTPVYSLIAFPENDKKNIPFGILGKKDRKVFLFIVKRNDELFDFDVAGGGGQYILIKGHLEVLMIIDRSLLL